MNLKINKAILRLWRKSYRNTPWLNETAESFQNSNLTNFDIGLLNYMLYNRWGMGIGVNIIFYSETRALD